jgi:hypothetical protein
VMLRPTFASMANAPSRRKETMFNLDIDCDR